MRSVFIQAFMGMVSIATLKALAPVIESDNNIIDIDKLRHKDEGEEGPQAKNTDSQLGLDPVWTNSTHLTLTDVENTLEYLGDHVKSLLSKVEKSRAIQTILQTDIYFLYSAFYGAIKQMQGKGTQGLHQFPSTGGNPFLPGVSDCGGVTTSDKGYIVYKSDQNHTQRILCTWTIRANTSEKIVLKLLSDTLDENSRIVMYSMKNMLRSRLTYSNILWSQQTLVAGDRNEYLFDGSTVFFTLITNATEDLHQTRPSFLLYFEGRGDPLKYTNISYNHFHYQSYFGSVSYPNGPQYGNNEIATFVLNPPVARGNMTVELDYLDIQKCSRCTCDFLRRWEIKKTRNYMYWGDKDHDYKNCGFDDDPNSRAGGVESESWIVIFSSDESIPKRGFRLVWNSD